MKLRQPFSYRDFQGLFELALKFPWICNREEAMLELWESTGNDENQKRLIEYLIHQFLYVGSDMSLEFTKQIALQITKVWGLRPYNTYITAACDHSHPDGSQQMVQKIKNHFPFGWREYDFVNSLPEAVYKLHSNDCLVICDDFIGTGDTMTRKIDYAKKVINNKGLQNVQIYVVVVAAMAFSQLKISGWQCPMFACRILPKGISETLTGVRQNVAIRIMEQMEGVLKPHIGKLHLPHFGYKRSESLYNYEDDNIPNNVFPLFWWKKYMDDRYRKPMFKRI